MLEESTRLKNMKLQKSNIKISPSILSADFGNLNQDIREVEPYADSLHIDVMDGHFVPNISFGSVIVKDIKTKLPLQVHLMISDPVKYAKEFAPYCRRISFHAELFNEKQLVKAIKVKNIKGTNRFLKCKKSIFDF